MVRVPQAKKLARDFCVIGNTGGKKNDLLDRYFVFNISDLSTRWKAQILQQLADF